MVTRRSFTRGSTAALLAGAPGLGQAQALPHGLRPGRPFAGTELTAIVPLLAQFGAQQRRLGEFERLTGIRVDMRFLPPNDIRDAIASTGARRSASVDVFNCADAWLPTLASNFIPLDELIKRDGFDLNRYPSGFKAAAGFDRNFFGLPIRGFAQLLFFRKDLFEREGLQPPRTWDEFVISANRLQRASNIGGAAMYYGRAENAASLNIWANYLWGRGGDILHSDFTPRFNDPVGIETTQFYIDLVLRHGVVASGSTDFTEANAIAAMAQGRAAMIMTWAWNHGALFGANAKLKREQVGIAPMPGYRGRPLATCATVSLLCMNLHSVRHEAAWEFLKWATNPELEMAIALDRSRPELIDDMVVHASSYENPDLNTLSAGMHRAAGASLSGSRVMPRLKEWPAVAQILDAAIAEAARGTRLTRSVLDDATRQVNRLLRSAGVIKE